MYIELKADDLMPFGKHKGITLRQIYNKDPSYFSSLCKDPQYGISKTTIKIVTKNLSTVEKTTPSFSKEPKRNRQELTIDSVMNRGPFEGSTLYEIYLTNESYYRYLCDNSYYISEQTYLDIQKRIGKSTSDKHCAQRKAPVFPKRKFATDITKIDLLSRLKAIYGPSAKFSDGQEEAIRDLLAGKKTLVVQKTGWGKSLVYFMATKIFREHGNGPAIIISPLLALMEDQAEKKEVKNQGLNVRYINSTPENKQEWPLIYEEIEQDKVDAIMIAPEKLDNPQFLEMMEDVIPRVSLFVIDEAHCIADWGHDFRPDYMRILDFVSKLTPGTPVLATTATANKRVTKDILSQIGEDVVIRRGDLERKNFKIDILDLKNDFYKKKWLFKFIPILCEKHPGIVYCLTVKACKRVTKELQERGINAASYYANLPDEEKKEKAQAFKNKEIDVLVATIAFGMGIDNKEIGFVVHFHKPANFVDYYQQIGRAGRDDRLVKEAYAIMLKGDKDDNTNRYFIENAFPEEWEMQRVLRYIEHRPKRGLRTISSDLNWGENGQERYAEDKVKRILSLLSIDGTITKNSRRQYIRTNKMWTYNTKEIASRKQERLDELEEFNAFVESDGCYMYQVRKALGDNTARDCGKCANCEGYYFFK